MSLYRILGFLLTVLYHNACKGMGNALAFFKLKRSTRDIPLPFCLLDEIQKHHQAPETFVLTGTTQCMEPRNIQKRYRRLLEQLGLRYLNFHLPRHSFATLSIQNGSDYRTVAELLGHSSVNTTINIYVHSGIEQKRQCLEMPIN